MLDNAVRRHIKAKDASEVYNGVIPKNFPTGKILSVRACESAQCGLDILETFGFITPAKQFIDVAFLCGKTGEELSENFRKLYDKFIKITDKNVKFDDEIITQINHLDVYNNDYLYRVETEVALNHLIFDLWHNGELELKTDTAKRVSDFYELVKKTNYFLIEVSPKFGKLHFKYTD